MSLGLFGQKKTSVVTIKSPLKLIPKKEQTTEEIQKEETIEKIANHLKDLNLLDEDENVGCVNINRRDSDKEINFTEYDSKVEKEREKPFQEEDDEKGRIIKVNSINNQINTDFGEEPYDNEQGNIFSSSITPQSFSNKNHNNKQYLENNLSPRSRNPNIKEVSHPFLRETEEGATNRTNEIEEDLKIYRKLGQRACNGIILYHSVDRMLSKELKDFFKNTFKFYNKFQQYLDEGSLIINESPLDKSLEDKLSFLKNFQENKKSLEEIRIKLQSPIKEERKENIITNCISYCDKILQSINLVGDRSATDVVEKILVALEDLKLRNNKNEYMIIVVGLEKAGKSTLLNALFGYNLLPAALTRCTLVVSHIKTSMDSYFSVRISFRSDSDLIEFLRYPTLKLSEDQIQSICSKNIYKEETKQFYTANDIRNYLEESLKMEEMQYIVDNIVIWVPNLRIGGARVIFSDTPGIDSKVTAHEKISLDMVPEADACIYVKRGTTPSWNLTSDKFSEKLQQKESIFNVKLDNDIQKERKNCIIVAITHLDELKTYSSFSEAVELNRQELSSKGLNVSFFVDARFSLLKQLSEDDSYELSDNERNELDSYLNSSVFQASGLGNGIDQLRKYLEKFIVADLPEMRAKDAVALLNTLSRLIERIHKNIRKEIPSETDFEAKLKHNDVEKIKNIWNEKVKNSREAANQWIYYNFVDKKYILIRDWEKTFISAFDKIFSDNQASVRDLNVEVAKWSHKFFNTDLNPIESSERERLVEFHLTALERAIKELSNELWKCLSNFATFLVESFGPELNLDWDLEEVIKYDQLFCEIESQVMSLIYPLLYATLQWQKNDPQRRNAVSELYNAVPHLFMKGNLDSVQREPSEQIFQVAKEIGFLP